jgi:hypothetical protein
MTQEPRDSRPGVTLDSVYVKTDTLLAGQPMRTRTAP